MVSYKEIFQSAITNCISAVWWIFWNMYMKFGIYRKKKHLLDGITITNKWKYKICFSKSFTEVS